MILTLRQLFLILILAISLPVGAQAQWREPPRTMEAAPQRYTGCRAVDGDTLACRQGRVRLRGVDTPERGESGYRAAQRELARRIRGTSVTVVPHHRDRYGRVVGDVHVRGSNVGRSMHADGYSKRRGARR
ncbi:thermonuclease family protein [Falsiroseomonas sp.]|uniref:thermonuclease family protein n=1 Tax=Falsiroseomonas sp. TaxID=2870721 RepID=UPI002723CBC2|nr:thermonuclease family protein [Falsiroseomonas sp.]MDO9501199.1 thermonuclease family protein [Falsiroseomonas sp.]